MIDCRSPKYRRIKDSSFDWSDLLNSFCFLVIIAAIGYICFMTGRHYETVTQRDTVNQASIFKEYKSARVGGHRDDRTIN